MSVVVGCLYVVEVLACLLLGLVIMLQKPKEGGLGGAFGAGMAEAAFGANAGNVLVKTTIVLSVIFLLNTLVLARLTSKAGNGSIMPETKVVQEQQPAQPAADTAAPAGDAAKPATAAPAEAAKPAAAPAAAKPVPVLPKESAPAEVK